MVRETDSAMVKAIPGRVRAMALQIIRNESQLWSIFVRQLRGTNPTEADQLQLLLDLAAANGADYLRELCGQTGAETEATHVC